MSVKLVCSYLQIPLSSPVIVGSCALTMQPESLRQMIACGAGAVVLPSIFQEQIEDHDRLLHDPLSSSTHDSEDLHQEEYNGGPDRYLASIAEIKRLSGVPLIASMNGFSNGNWLNFAKHIEASGADALELNIQPLVANPQQTSEDIEAVLCESVHRVCESVAIPVAVKLTQHITNLANVVQRLRLAGAAGVVLFAHEARWDVAIDRLSWTVDWELTPVGSATATVGGIIRSRVGGLGLSIAASGGVCTSEDALKVMIAGADVVMITSEIYRAGPEAIRRIVQGIQRSLEAGGFDSIAQFQESRPIPKTRSPRMMRRLDYLDPLTRSATITDPTPVVERQTGDRYGHQD